MSGSHRLFSCGEWSHVRMIQGVVHLVTGASRGISWPMPCAIARVLNTPLRIARNEDHLNRAVKSDPERLATYISLFSNYCEVKIDPFRRSHPELTL
jgi:hypothetical protein